MVSTHTLAVASRYQLAALALLLLVSAFAWPEGFSGLTLGGLITSLNFLMMRRMARGVLGTQKPKTAYIAALGLKFVVLLSLVAVSMLYLHPDALGFALGLGTLFVGVGLATAQLSWGSADQLGEEPRVGA